MSPRKRISPVRLRAVRAVLGEQGRLEDAFVREQLALLAQMRRAVQAELANAAGFRTFHLSQILQAIDREIARGRQAAQTSASARTQAAFGFGQELVSRPLATLGVRQGLADLSTPLVSAAIDVTNDQIRSVWSELGTKLKVTVRRTALGIDDPNKAVADLARVIRDPKTFGTAQARAEAIVRTEVNRTFSMATHARMLQSNRRLAGGLKKYWLDAGDSRVRDDHRQAGKDYAAGPDTAIPVGQAFLVGGEKLMFPRDPRGSAANTINCRCASVPWVEDLADQGVAA